MTYNLNKKLVQSNIDTIHKEITDKVILQLDNYLKVPITINYLNSAILRVEPGHSTDLEPIRKIFAEQMRIFKTVNIIAFGTESKKYVEAQRISPTIIRTGEIKDNNLLLWKTDSAGRKLSIEQIIYNYNPKTRPWYKTTKDMKKQNWSDIYLYASTGQPAISSNLPYFTNNIFHGVFTTSITLEGISKFLSELNLSDNSFVLVTDPEGYTIASSEEIPILDSEKERIHSSNLENSVLSGVSKLFIDLNNSEDKISRQKLKIGNDHYYINATPYYGPQSLKWELFVIIPEKDFMTAFFIATKYGIILLLIFSIFTISISFLIARKVTDPIENLSSMVSQTTLKNNRITEWDISENILKRKDEIGILANSFNNLGERLNSTLAYLLQSKKEYKDLVENINSIIMRVREDGTITYCNPFALEFYGYTEEELIGKSVQETVLKTNNPANSNIFREIFNKNTKFWSGINKNTKSDGTEVWILWSNTMIYEYDDTKKELLSIGQDITARKEVEIKLNESLDEKNILLKEVHHRVKNNLQIITSLINLQLGDISNEKIQDTLESLQSRIQSIAIIHEMLYASDSINKIDFYDYLHKIVINISATHNRTSNPILIDVQGNDFYLDIERSTTCGLIVNELIINAYKHAFVNIGNSECRIDINISKSDSGLVKIIIKDNGVGINTEAESGMGSLLIEALVDQLEGKITTESDSGTIFTITFQY